MKFVSFNVRRDFDFDKEQRFLNRKPLIEKKLRAELPDVVCFQEVLPDAKMWLKQILPEYDVLGCGRDPKLQDETAVIAYKKERFDLIAMETFWLSETPTIPGSRYEQQSPCPRTCTEVLLKDITNGRIFRVFNAHLDHEGYEARVLGAKQIVEKSKNATLFQDAWVLFAGDFNAGPNDPEILWIPEHSGWVDFSADSGITFHAFGNEAVSNKIDYVFGNKEWNCLSCTTWDDMENGLYISDHNAVCVEFED